ncbi:G-protein coupled receptor 183-B-like [Littorina saxatilis]
MAAKSYTIVGLFDEEAGSYWQQRYLNTVLGPLGGFLNVSNAMTTVIAVERCICIVAPFRAKRMLKTRYMAFVILSLYIYVLGVFGFLNVKYVTVPLPPNDASSNVTRYISRLSQFYVRNPVFIDVVCNYLLAVVIPATSLVVIIITTSVTVNKLRASLAWKRQETTAVVTSGERREAAVTTMLVMVCCVYVICMTPSVTLAFVRNLITDFLPTGRYCNAFKVTTALVHTCEVVNSSTNFFIYFFRGTRYRTTLRRLCCCTKEGTTKPDVTDASSSRF